MHHLLHRRRGLQLAGVRLSPLWIGIAVGAIVLATGSAICTTLIGRKQRRAREDDAQRVATWEGEGGATNEPAVGY